MLTVFVVLGSLLYANCIELLVHKHLFHQLGKKKNSIFAFHLRDHHVIAKKNKFVDKRHTIRESFGILFLALIHTPILFVSPVAYFSICIYGASFILVHHFQHRHPEFTKKHMWWHWNHHMVSPNENWCIVSPVADYIYGSLKK